MTLLIEPVMYIIMALGERAGVDFVIERDEATEEENDSLALSAKLNKERRENMQKFKELNMMLPFLSPESQAQLETIEPEENIDGNADVTLGEDSAGKSPSGSTTRGYGIMVQGIDATHSLLDEQKQRRANEAARRERKRELQDNITKLLVEGGLYLGNAILADKTQDFVNSTEQRGLRRMANAADANIDFLKKEATKMEQHTGDRLDYMMAQVTPLVTAEFKAETEDYREGQDPYNYALQNRIREVAQERLRLFEEAEAIYKDKDMNNFGDRLDVLQNKYTDSSLTEFAVSAVRNIGKSKEDLEMEEILAFKDFVDQQTEGTRGYYAAQLQDLVTAYNRTGDLALSSRFAKEANVDTVLGDPTKEERFAYKTTIKFSRVWPIKQ